VTVHVSPKSLRFTELEGTESTFVDLPTLIFSILPAVFLFPATCQQINNNILFKQLRWDHYFPLINIPNFPYIIKYIFSISLIYLLTYLFIYYFYFSSQVLFQYVWHYIWSLKKLGSMEKDKREGKKFNKRKKGS